jgi:secreted PhoX family phosphatase
MRCRWRPAPRTGQVAIFASGANGDVAPVRRIAGINASLRAPSGTWVDETGNLYVADSGFGLSGAVPDVQVFAPGATGNVAASRVIKRSHTNLSRPFSILLDSFGELYVSNNGNNSVTVYAPGASGDAAPVQQITISAFGFTGPPSGIAVR